MSGRTGFRIDPEVARARTLPSRFYLDPEVFAAVRETVFARCWHWLGPLQGTPELAQPQSLLPVELLPGFLDEPLVLVRDAAAQLRCLSNVCTHRGNLLLREPCRAAQIRCGYHSRRFALDGRMTFMPGFEGALDFPGPTDHLPVLPLESVLGHLMVALRPSAPPIAAVFGDICSRVGWMGVDGFVADPLRSREFEVDAHWALYVENYLEGLHIPFLHPGLARTLDTDDYRYELFEWANLQLAFARDGETCFDNLPPTSPEHGLRVAAYYYWVFPNLMLNFYPWGLSVNVVTPLAPGRTRISFRSFVGDPSRLAAGAGGALDQVELEDEAAVQAVQRGLRSRLYDRGRYSPQHEIGVHQFHRLLAAGELGGRDFRSR
jgi:choline monooxygenase